jgi:hypothetical protein
MGAKAPQPPPNRRTDGTTDEGYAKPSASPPPPPPQGGRGSVRGSDQRPACPATSFAERQCLNHLAEAWRVWVSLEDKHPSDLEEFAFHIHALQNLIAWRVARAVDPETWG